MFTFPQQKYVSSFVKWLVNRIEVDIKLFIAQKCLCTYVPSLCFFLAFFKLIHGLRIKNRIQIKKNMCALKMLFGHPYSMMITIKHEYALFKCIREMSQYSHVSNRYNKSGAKFQQTLQKSAKITSKSKKENPTVNSAAKERQSNSRYFGRLRLQRQQRFWGTYCVRWENNISPGGNMLVSSSCM